MPRSLSPSGFKMKPDIPSSRMQPASQGPLQCPLVQVFLSFFHLQTGLMSSRLVPVRVDERSPSEGTNWAISQRGNLEEQQAHTFNKRPPVGAQQGAVVEPNGRPADTQSVLLTNVLPAQAAINEKVREWELNGGHLSVSSCCQWTTLIFLMITLPPEMQDKTF